jgi:hypothetical protein
MPSGFGITVFDVEPFGHELKAEWLRRNEKFSVTSKRISANNNSCPNRILL